MIIQPLGTPASICFLDETGVIAQDTYFAVGALTLSETSILPTLVSKYRQRTQWQREWHFSEVNDHRLGLYKGLIDLLREDATWSFNATLADRSEFDVASICGDRYLAYERIAAQSLAESMTSDRQAVVLADEYSTPDSVRFEEDVRWAVNQFFGSNIVAGVVRVNSRSHDLLQVSDVLTGSLTYPFRGLSPRSNKRPSAKKRLSNYIARQIGHRLELSPFHPGWLGLPPQ